MLYSTTKVGMRRLLIKYNGLLLKHNSTFKQDLQVVTVLSPPAMHAGSTAWRMAPRSTLKLSRRWTC